MKFAKRLLKFSLGIFFTCLFFYLAYGRLEWDRLIANLVSTSPGPLILALVFLGLDFFLRIFRWWWILKSMEPTLPLRRCVWPFLVSIGLNNVLPFRAGDLMRLVGFRRQLQSSGMQLLGSMTIERLFDFIVLLGFLFSGLWTLSPGKLPDVFIHFSVWMGVGVLAVFFGLVFIPHHLHSVFNWFLLKFLVSSQDWFAKASRYLEQLFSAFYLLRSKKLSFQLMILSVLAWTMEGAVFVSVAHSFRDPVSPAGAWFSLATGTLGTLVPSSPGYVGTFDYFTMLGVMAHGVHRENAAAFALIVHGILWVPLTLSGLSYFFLPGGQELWHKANNLVFSNEGRGFFNSCD